MFALPMDNAPVQSKSAEIVIRQQPAHVGCLPQWGHIQPTPSLTQHGLTTNKLREIIDSINTQSTKDFEDNYSQIFDLLVYIPMVGVLMGTVMCFASFGSSHTIGMFMPGCVMAFICSIASALVSFLNENKYINATQIAINGMREYVENTLNEQWQDPSGIRWTVVTQQTYHLRHHYHHDHSYGSYQNQYSHSLGVDTQYHIQVMLLDPTVPMAVSAPSAPELVDSNNDGEGEYYQ